MVPQDNTSIEEEKTGRKGEVGTSRTKTTNRSRTRTAPIHTSLVKTCIRGTAGGPGRTLRTHPWRRLGKKKTRSPGAASATRKKGGRKGRSSRGWRGTGVEEQQGGFPTFNLTKKADRGVGGGNRLAS